jgi:hypothetical protein
MYSAAIQRQQRQQQQQQQQQQLLDMQCELAWRLSDWGVADSLIADGAAAAVAGRGGGSLAVAAAAAVKSAHASVQSNFNAAVLSALQALQSKDLEGFTASVSGARHECVLQLARSSTQSAAAVNPLLVRLRMLQMLQQGLGWARKEAAAAASAAVAGQRELDAARASSRGGSMEFNTASEGNAEQLLRHLLGVDFLSGGGSVTAELLRTSRFQLSDQLLSLQAALTKVLKRPDALALTLQAHARTARRAGQANFALAALNQLQQLLQQACAFAGGHSAADSWKLLNGSASPAQVQQTQQLKKWLQGLVSPEAPWLLENVQLKWQQGQQLPAFRELQALVAALQTQQQQQQQEGQRQAGGSVSRQSEALMRAQVLAGKWMAAGQFSSSGDSALSAFKAAAALAQQQQQDAAAAAGRRGGSQSTQAELSRLHCSVYFQLASYADQRFKEIEAQMASPEWQKQKQVLQYKEGVWNAIIARAQELRRLPPAKQGSQAVQAEIKALNRQAGMQKQVINDKEIVQQVEKNRAACLRTALSSYRLCIATGNTHDLQVWRQGRQCCFSISCCMLQHVVGWHD